MSRKVVIIDGCRTPFGKFGGTLSHTSAPELGAHTLSSLLKRSALPNDAIDQVIMGTALMAGVGYTPARQAAVLADLDRQTDFLSLNNACASAARAVNLALLLIASGECDIVIAGGMENMSRVPYLLPDTRWGKRMGDAKVLDALQVDGLQDPFYHVQMGTLAGWVAKENNISRKEMDEWALRSHQRALDAWEKGKFEREVVSIDIELKRQKITFSKDEALRPDTSLEKLAQLPPVFEKEGAITAGNAPGLSDGAAALILMAAEKAKDLGLEPLAEICGGGWASLDAKYIATVPSVAIRKASEKTGIRLSSFKRIEINEAFAAVPLVSGKLLGIEDIDTTLNPKGGAVAMGHPVAASGARILMTLVYELRDLGGGFGVAAICGAGCSGDAVVVKV